MIEKVALADVSVHLIVISAALEPSTLVSHSSLITAEKFAGQVYTVVKVVAVKDTAAFFSRVAI